MNLGYIKKALILCLMTVIIFLSCPNQMSPKEGFDKEIIHEGYIRYTNAIDDLKSNPNDIKMYQSKVVIEYQFKDLYTIKDREDFSYQQINQMLFNSLSEKMSYLDIYHSRYAPFTEITVEKLDDHLMAILKKALKNTWIQNIFVYHEEINGVKPDYLSEKPTKEIDDIDSGVGNYEAVKVGVFETKSTMLDAFNPYLLKLKSLVIHPNIVLHFNPFDVYHRHATHVAATIAKEYGNNSKLDLYFSNITIGFFQGLEWFLDQQVDVLNMSFNTSNSNEGIYTSHARFLDYISYHHPMVIVVAAGNRGQSTKLVGGTSYNVITVGALSIAKDTLKYELADYSSYLLAPGFINSKPNVVASGFSYNNQWIGTSFATPRVAAVISKWISYYPELKTSKALIMSLIHTAATRKDILNLYRDYDVSGLEKMIGAGEASFYYGTQIMNNQTGVELRIENQGYNFPREIYRMPLLLNAGQNLRVTVASFVQVLDLNTQNLDVDINDYRIRLLYEGNQIFSTYGKTNIEMINFDITSSGHYEILVTIEGRLVNAKRYDMVGISYRTSYIEPPR